MLLFGEKVSVQLDRSSTNIAIGARRPKFSTPRLHRYPLTRRDQPLKS